jgi:alkyl sulfatase BDS1-like metallo-beta-lactamase superfamily hydrolase
MQPDPYNDHIAKLAHANLVKRGLVRGHTPPPASSENTLEEARRLVATDDRKDFDFATRGFIATRKDPIIRRPDGRVAVDLTGYTVRAPVRSSAGMNSTGDTVPRSGCFQRRSASSDTMRPSEKLAFGW